MHGITVSKILLIFLVTVLPSGRGVFGQTNIGGDFVVSKCWTYNSNETVTGVFVENGRVLLTTAGARVEVLDANGTKQWSSEFGGEVSSNLLGMNGSLVFATSADSIGGTKFRESVLRSISEETGITNWTLKLPPATQFYLNRFNRSLITVTSSGIILSVDSATGGVIWKREIAVGFVAKPVLGGGKLYVAGKNNNIFSILLSSGEIDSIRKSVDAVKSIDELVAGEIVMGDARGGVSVLNGTNQAVWKFKTGGEVSRVFSVNDHVIAASFDNFVYYLSGRNGGVKWKKRMPGRVNRIVNVTDKYVMLSSVEESNAVLVEYDSGKVVGQILFQPGEEIVADPAVSGDAIYLTTDRATYSFGLNGCTAKKKGGTGK